MMEMREKPWGVNKHDETVDDASDSNAVAWKNKTRVKLRPTTAIIPLCFPAGALFHQDDAPSVVTTLGLGK